jgi:uncharacterized protein (TIGR02217 family)
MARFVDKYLSARIQGYPVEVAPNFSTQIVRVDSGAEQANRRWQDALRDISIPNGVRDVATFEALKLHWLSMGGPAHTWPWRDPLDFATAELAQPNTAPATTRTDTRFGVGDGVTLEFQLKKRYELGSPSTPYDRVINLPIVSTVEIGIDGVDPTALSPAITWTVTRLGGVVTFSSAPANGAVLTWGGLFDLPVRFADDETFRGVMRTFSVSGFADVPLTETRWCED